MRKLSIVLVGIAGLLLSACTSTISSSPVSLDSASVLGKDLAAAKFNLDNAVLVGALPADDPAVGCVSAVLADLGLDKEAVSFEPQREGVVSVGSVIYIRVAQAKAFKDSFKLPSDCDAVVGRLVIDSVKAGSKALPGAGLLLR